MNNITEIMPDNIPEWMQKAINNGTFAETVIKNESDLSDAKREAEGLALALSKRHYPEDFPNLELCDSVADVITQIDNMTSGIGNKLEAQGVVIQELKTALLELKRPLKNAYEHIQHKDYNDALSSILEAQAIAEK